MYSFFPQEGKGKSSNTYPKVEFISRNPALELLTRNPTPQADHQRETPKQEMDVLTEHSTDVPIQHRFDPYTQNGGSVLGAHPPKLQLIAQPLQEKTLL